MLRAGYRLLTEHVIVVHCAGDRWMIDAISAGCSVARHTVHSWQTGWKWSVVRMLKWYHVQASLLSSITVVFQHNFHPLTSNRHHLSYDDCLENKGRLQDCSCSIGSYHCIHCYAHILWAAPTGQTDLPLSHWVHFTVLRCICVFVSSCILLHACCIIVTRWGGPGGIEAWSDDWPSSFSALTLLAGSHDL